MARIHGRSGRLYAAITSGGTAEPIAFLNTWSLSFATDNIDVTSFGDTNKVMLAGLPASDGDFGGFYDDASPQLYTAATDGVARKFYLYPSTNNNGQYWHGTAVFDFSISADVAGAVTVQGNFEGASQVQKVG